MVVDWEATKNPVPENFDNNGPLDGNFHRPGMYLPPVFSQTEMTWGRPQKSGKNRLCKNIRWPYVAKDLTDYNKNKELLIDLFIVYL